MSDQFQNKNYSEYFAKLQQQIEKEKSDSESLKNNNTEALNSEIKKSKPNFRFRVISLHLKKQTLFHIAIVFFSVLCLFSVFMCIRSVTHREAASKSVSHSASDISESADKKNPVSFFADFPNSVEEVNPDVTAKSVIMINCDENRVVAARNATSRYSPASTTKIMTMLTAMDLIKDFNDTFTMTREITDSMYIAEASVAGFAVDEKVSITDLLYGVILPSGGDAAIGLAVKLAGSEEKFVDLMNKKADQMKLEDTHFTNVTGLYDKEHYTTARDMAAMLNAAMQNELCKKILSTYQYTTASTQQHPEGILLTSTLFSHMYGTEPETSDIIGGKTGYVGEAGYCIASFGKADSGTEYICVAFKSDSLWPAIYDQFKLYNAFAK